MRLKHKVIHGLRWNLLQQLGSQLIVFLVLVLLARILSPEDFGLVALTNIFINLITLLATQGMDSAIAQRKELSSDHLNAAFWLNIGIALILIPSLVFAAAPIALLFDEPKLQQLIPLLSISVLFISAANVHQGVLRRNLDFKHLALRSLAGTLAGNVTAVIMALSGYGVWSLVGRQLVNTIINTTILWWFSSWRPQFRFSLNHLRELLGFSTSMLGNNLLTFVSRQSYSFLIGYYLGTAALGYYNLSNRILNMLMRLMANPILNITMPVFSKMQDDKARVQAAFVNLIQLSSLAACPVFIGISLTSPELIILLFGEQWEDSIPVMQLLALAGLMQVLINSNMAVIVGLGKPSFRLAIQTTESIAKVIAFFFSVQWGIVAVAGSYLAVSMLFVPVWFWVAGKLMHTDSLLLSSGWGTALLGALIMAVTVVSSKHVMPLDPLQQLLASSMAGALTYMLFIYISSPEQAKKLTSLFSRVIKS